MAGISFPEFLAKEEQNLLISMLKYRPVIDVFNSLDALFQAPLPALKIALEEKPIFDLYLFVHYHFYTSITQLMRSHLAESFSSTRKAIDATLSAYAMLSDSNNVELYLNRNKKLQNIKGYIKDQKARNPAQFTLADELLQLHGIYSKLGSHADVSSFEHRSEIINTNITLQYFQFPKNDDEYRYYYFEAINAFAQMLKIFRNKLYERNETLTEQWDTFLNETLSHTHDQKNKFKKLNDQSMR